MKVIVKESGFYGGTWFEESRKHQEMPGAVARAFLPPRGHQLAEVPVTSAAAKREADRPVSKPEASKAG